MSLREASSVHFDFVTTKPYEKKKTKKQVRVLSDFGTYL